MDKAEFSRVRAVVKGLDNSEMSHNAHVHTPDPEEHEDAPFVDVYTNSPAWVLNGLHKAGLLSSPETRSRADTQPRLKWIDTVPVETRGFLMTFVDTFTAQSSEIYQRW